jgi:acyl-CoA reductase-like NAD-dependent aldehyde dehydrogenase
MRTPHRARWLCDTLTLVHRLWACNSVILKPSEKVPGAAVVLARLMQEAGIPNGVFQVLYAGADPGGCLRL